MITLTLSAENRDYSAAMEKASEQIDDLRSRIVGAGFDGTSLKTVSFNVQTEYDSIQDEKGRYTNVFRGYRCIHSLRLEFELDLDRLNSALAAASAGDSAPELSVSFTVKDPEAVNSEVLKNAAANARTKAEVLCAASGVKLGTLLNIEYNWGDRPYTSPTRYELNDCAPKLAMARGVSFEPEDITVSDSAAFIWEIG